MAGTSQEYVVRAPNENSKRFNVMRFANSLNVDVTKWKVARMERERSLKHQERTATEETPKFGFGSEYGKDAKDEARRLRYAKYAKKIDDCPWVLRVGGKNGRKFKGTREGGVTENTSYYVFFQAHDGAFEAFPVSEWYNFTAIPRYKPLTSEEAEEKFEERHKIYNHFAVMASRKNTEGGEADQTETKLMKKIKKEKDFKVSDMDDWVDSDKSFDGSDDDDEGDTKKNGKGKGAAKKKGGKKKKKGSDDEDDDSEPGEESDEGDHEAREVDYMSDTSSSSDEEDLEERLNKELKGVEDEDGLRKLALSDEDEEEEEEENKVKEDAVGVKQADSGDASKANEADGKAKTKQEKNSAFDSGTSASDDSDDSDLDDSKFQSAMFLQKKSGSASKTKNGTELKPSGSRSENPVTVTDSAGQPSAGDNNGDNDNKSAMKRKFPAAENSPVLHKKPKTNDPNSGGEVISEEAVRRYLVRKPMTAKDLLQKFKGRKVPLEKHEIVQKIAQILKNLNPEKQMIKGKLYLHIKPPNGP